MGKELTKTRYPGIYLHKGGKYKWCYRDGGRQVWCYSEKLTGPTGAVAQRADVLARLGRGERVAPAKLNFGELAAVWYAEQESRQERGDISRGYVKGHDAELRLRLLPRFQDRRVSAITVDDVAALVRDLQKQKLAGWSIQRTLITLSGVLGYAARRGHVRENAVKLLDRQERPKKRGREMRILDEEQIAVLLEAASVKYRTLLMAAIFTGLRVGELLGLRWEHVDFGAGFLYVRQQWTKHGEFTPPKGGVLRDVVLIPELARTLRMHKAASPFSQEHDLVFANERGKPMLHGNVEKRGLTKAREHAKLPEEPKLRFHDLRHTYASMLIVGLKQDPATVAAQLGHSSNGKPDPSVTLKVYTHLFDQARNAEKLRDDFSAGFGALLT